MPVKTSPEATVGSDGKKLPYLNKDQSTVKHRHRKTR